MNMATNIFLPVITLFAFTGATSFNKILQGSFFQPGLAVKWGGEGFAKEFEYMKAVKMDHAIWQWTVDSKAKLAWYPTNLKGYKQVTNYDALEASLSEAAKHGLKVWIGLNDNSDWWKHYAFDEAWLHNEFEIGRQIVTEVWEKYGDKYNEAISGFYVVFEMDNVNFFKKEAKRRMAREYKGTADHVHKLTKKMLMVAPFFNAFYGAKKMDEKQYAKLWHDILLTADIDIIAMQDGIGVKHCDLTKVANWFYQMKVAIYAARPKTQLWTDLETFESAGNSSFKPAPISRIIQQLMIESPYIQGITSFSFNHYDSPQQGHQQEFTEYANYVNSYFTK